MLLGVVMLALAAALLAFLPHEFNVDSWLALVTGREVWQTGLPHHEVLTSLSSGIPWIDQQWLSQLATYGLYLLGGLGLVGLASMALIVFGVGGAVVGARRLGAPPRSVLLILPLCLWLMGPSHEVRTQVFAMPLFVGLAYLLSSDSRAPSRRVYWCLPILVVWANLHGTVTLGAVLVALRGTTVAWERRAVLRGSLRQWRRPSALTLGAPLCLLATPYGLSIFSYYRTMFFGSTVMHSVPEWQPITSEVLLAIPFLLTAAIVVWSFARNSSRSTLWEKLALVALGAGSISVVRNLLFFALLVLLVLPVALGQGDRAKARPATRGRAPINALLFAAAVGAVLIGAVAALARPASTIESSYQRPGVLTAVETATRAHPSARVLTDFRFADWLLWRDPALSGRIANDVRFELLTPSQMSNLRAVYSTTGKNWKRGARGYRLIVLDSRYDPNAVLAFRAEPGSRVLYNDGERIVILRSAREAGR
jgi:hypothetical protein